MKKTIEEKAEFLRKCASQYELNGTSPLSDDEYDALVKELRLEDPENLFFSEVGGQLNTEEHIYGTKISHKYIMGSLCKDPNPEEFGKWLEKTFGKDVEKIVALLQIKVDGTAFCLQYQDNKFIRGVSRGNGLVGIDYSNNIRHVKGFKEKINAKGYVEIKGEVYKNLQDFVSEGWEKQGYANARNMASGSLNQKLSSVTKERKLNFIAYEVRGVDFETETEKMKFLIDNGFDTLKNYTSKIDCKGRSAEEVVKAIKNYMAKIDRDRLPFPIDGVVFKLNDIVWGESFGTTDGGKRPKAAQRAIKLETDKAETTLTGIEWNIGRTGNLTIVDLFNPVQLAGTTVKRASLHNLKEMVERLGITRLGAKVVLEKCGDIIPGVSKVIKDGDGEKIQIPNKCPSCNGDIEFDATKTTKVCTNDNCPAQLSRTIEHWLKTNGILNIGESTISTLMEKSYVTHISDMYDLKKYTAELSEIFGNKAFENILEAMNSVKEITLATFIEALGIARIGRMSKDLVSSAPTLKDIDNLTEDDITMIQGFGGVKAKSFVTEWKAQRKEIDKLLKYITIIEPKLSSSKLAGKKFCFTGSFSNPTRGEMEKMVEDNGGKLSSVSKNLTALVWDGEIQGGKMEKAKELKVPIINQKDFLALL